MTNNETAQAMAQIVDTIAGLETNIDQLTRRLEQLQDITRAAQYLVDAIHVSQIAEHENTGELFSEAYANIRAALRAYYAPNGTGR
jgi:uncharacterized protein Yka (UPF0111/DUF47 family)